MATRTERLNFILSADVSKLKPGMDKAGAAFDDLSKKSTKGSKRVKDALKATSDQLGEVGAKCFVGTVIHVGIVRHGDPLGLNLHLVAGLVVSESRWGRDQERVIHAPIGLDGIHHKADRGMRDGFAAVGGLVGANDESFGGSA